jgi:hypothetical protein
VLAGILDDAEGDQRWHADPPTALTPVLSLREATESSLTPDRIVDEIVTWLAGAPAAWDPWRPPR